LKIQRKLINYGDDVLLVIISYYKNASQ
jgi:hypothetical protein